MAPQFEAICRFNIFILFGQLSPINNVPCNYNQGGFHSLVVGQPLNVKWCLPPPTPVATLLISYTCCPQDPPQEPQDPQSQAAPPSQFFDQYKLKLQNFGKLKLLYAGVSIQPLQKSDFTQRESRKILFREIYKNYIFFAAERFCFGHDWLLYLIFF